MEKKPFKLEERESTIPITVITDHGLARQWVETWKDILTGESASITRTQYLYDSELDED